MIKVTIWNENVHEKRNPKVTAIYPDGMHQAIAVGIRHEGFHIQTATLEEHEHGLTQEVLNNTDVLVWWGHAAQEQVRDDIVERVHRHVIQGMGLIVLHSGCLSKIFKKLMGTTCEMKWRAVGEKERLWVVNPAHSIAEGLGEYIELPHEEMYGEYFDIPTPDEVVFISWFEGGEVCRSGCTYQRGQGKIFYFRPGHETYPTYHNKDVLRVIANACRWAAPQPGVAPTFGNVQPLEEIKTKSS
jgi:trehalose utilization protein